MNENFSRTVVAPKQPFSWAYMIEHIDKALIVLRKKPNDGEMLYDLIYHTYIIPEALTHLDILDRIHISSRHYYRLREKAINVLSVILWSSIAREVINLLEQRAYAVFREFVDSVIDTLITSKGTEVDIMMITRLKLEKFDINLIVDALNAKMLKEK